MHTAILLMITVSARCRQRRTNYAKEGMARTKEVDINERKSLREKTPCNPSTGAKGLRIGL